MIRIHQVWYADDAGQGPIVALSLEPVSLEAVTEQELDQRLAQLQRALYSPVLDFAQVRDAIDAWVASVGDQDPEAAIAELLQYAEERAG